jgi:tetraacyldisaccharide 4'-kinase
MKNGLKEYIYRIVTDREAGVRARIVKFLLLILSIFYGFGISVLTWSYRSGWLKASESGKRVVSVGNLTVGGSGKTPLVIYIAKHLLKRGWRPAIVTRGYMPVPGQKSDEVMMLEELLPNVPVLAGPDKLESIRSSHANVCILDDGFQHRQLKRNLDIVVIDVENPFGNGWMLPRGILREPLSALKRADLVVLTHVNMNTSRENIQNVLAVVEEWAHKAVVIHTVHEAVSVSVFPGRLERKGLEELRDRVCLVSAIGSPQTFRRSVESLGAVVVGEVTFMDHHVYTQEDIKSIVDGCRRQNISKIVTTHKDAVKLVSFHQQLSGLSVLVLDIELRILHGENEFLSSLDRLLNP